MTFKQAIKEVFNQCGNLPMTSKEVWNEISEQNLVQSKGKTPLASVNSIMILSSENSDAKSKSKGDVKNPFLEITDHNPMKFRLLKNVICVSEDEPEEVISEEEIILDRTLLYEVTSRELNWKKLSIYNHEENIEYVISDCDEFTYIMKDDAHATLKIGKTKNDPDIRLNQLKTGNPSISILHVFPSSQFSESTLHNKYNDFRKDLEWFFYAKGLKGFFNNEINKTKIISKSYEKKIELDEQESKMIDLIMNEI